jgi:hypothetical protein
MKKTFSLKNISSCLLAVACSVVVSIPTFVHIGLIINSPPETIYTLDNATLAWMWVVTISLMNCTFNCLIFTGKTRCYVPKDWKLWKAWKYVDELNPSCTKT